MCMCMCMCMGMYMGGDRYMHTCVCTSTIHAQVMYACMR